MKVSVIKTFVETTPGGMVVGNAGETIDLPDEFIERRLEGGFIEVDEMPAPEDDGDAAPAPKPAARRTGGRKPKAAAESKAAAEPKAAALEAPTA
jgi:hypothetical protein